MSETQRTALSFRVADVRRVKPSSLTLATLSMSAFADLLLLIVLPSRQVAGALPPYMVRSSSPASAQTSLSLKYSPGVIGPGEELRGGSSSPGVYEFGDEEEASV